MATPEARFRSEGETVDAVFAAAVNPGEVLQLPDGRAGFYEGANSVAAGDVVPLRVCGIARVEKTASKVVLVGSAVYWDTSASKAALLPANGDFYVGRAVVDSVATDTYVEVALNIDPPGFVDLRRGAWSTAIVKTAGSPVVEALAGGAMRLAFSATAEAQKVDILSDLAVPVTRQWIAEHLVNIVDIGDEASVDISIGVANATHASDADSITESAFFHLDGTALSILAESDDGTTEVAATDTTVDAVTGTPVLLQIDGRNLADLQYYINGVNVLPASVFKLDAATGPLKALVHMEKGANDTPGEVRVLMSRIRTLD